MVYINKLTEAALHTAVLLKCFGYSQSVNRCGVGWDLWEQTYCVRLAGIQRLGCKTDKYGRNENYSCGGSSSWYSTIPSVYPVSLRPLVALRPCAPMQCDDRCVTADYRYHALTPQTDHAL